MRDELQKKETTNSEKKAGTSLSLLFSFSLPVLFCCEAGTSLSLSFSFSLPVLFCCEAGTSLSLLFLYWSLSLCGLSTGLSSSTLLAPRNMLLRMFYHRADTELSNYSSAFWINVAS